MKYRLTEDLKMLGWKRGQIMEEDAEINYPKMVRSLLLKTGILEEVKEEEWLKNGDEYWYVDDEGQTCEVEWGMQGRFDKNRVAFGNVFRSETAAKEASEKIKALLLSLKK